MKSELPYPIPMNGLNPAMNYPNPNSSELKPQQPIASVPNSLQFNNVLDQGVQIKPQPVVNPNAVQEYLENNFQNINPTTPIQGKPTSGKRSFTVAELLVFLVASMIALEGIKTVWTVSPKPIISIEWRR